MKYYLFRYGPAGSYGYRIERAAGPREACRLAFGMIYDYGNTEVVYKDAGGNKRKLQTWKFMEGLRTSEGWLRVPTTGD